MTLFSGTTVAAVDDVGEASIIAVHTDIVQTHILTRLDGPTLASVGSTSSDLLSISSQNQLWFDICHATWPSTLSPRVQKIISDFPDFPETGPRSFFANSYPLPVFTTAATVPSPPPEMMSAVDIHFNNNLIFSKVEITETVTGWFRCSPFRIDLMDPKDVVPTGIKHPNDNDKCMDLMKDMKLSWIMIDPIQRQSVNLSSHAPVSVQLHWLSGDVQLRFASILAVDQKDHVQCVIEVTCGGSEGGEMQVKEVSMQVESMDGTHLNGKDSLVILQRAMEGKKGKGKNREEEARKRYIQYLSLQKERRERKLRYEGTLDILCVTFGISLFAAICFLFLFRH